MEVTRSGDGHLSQIVIVLYQPQDIVNVAAIIRVMSNFGLPYLRVVEPAAWDPYRIEGIAHGTERLVEAAQRFSTLQEAVADCTFILGTTGRPRQAEHRVFSPRQAAPLLLQAGELAGERKVAVLFGREQDGLPNEALELCHGVLSIPTHPENRSLNLAQAALVVAYELWMAAEQVVMVEPTPDLADGHSREAMFAALQGLLLALYPGTTEARLSASMARLRAMLMRSAPREEEAEALANLCRHAVRELMRK